MSFICFCTFSTLAIACTCFCTISLGFAFTSSFFVSTFFFSSFFFSCSTFFSRSFFFSGASSLTATGGRPRVLKSGSSSDGTIAMKAPAPTDKMARMNRLSHGHRFIGLAHGRGSGGCT